MVDIVNGIGGRKGVNITDKIKRRKCGYKVVTQMYECSYIIEQMRKEKGTKRVAWGREAVDGTQHAFQRACSALSSSRQSVGETNLLLMAPPCLLLLSIISFAMTSFL